MLTIRKRNGDVVPYTEAKIKAAITAAWLEAKPLDVDDLLITLMVDEVTRWLDWQSTQFKLEDSAKVFEADVERVQDVVEKVLMDANQFDVAKAYILYRQKRTEERVRTKPDPTGLSNYIHAAKYARYLPEMQRREVYDETVDRVELMHQKRFAHVPGMGSLITWAFGFVREKKVLGSMRVAQFAGPAVEASEIRSYNCTASLVDRPRVFAEALYLLLSGCGVGYSVQFEHVEKLPPLVFVDPKKVVHHVVGDTIEGWADAVDALVNSYCLDGTYIEFSFHQIRSAGTPLKTSGGRAPGHRKLKETLERVRGVLDGAQGRQLRPIECHRMMCHIADAVLAGGIRRSAAICLFSIDDGEMMNCKVDPAWFTREPWFANANNSAVLKRSEVTEKQFKRLFKSTRAFGEPGFLFVEDNSHVTNPCVPAGTRILTREGYRAIETLVGRPTVAWNGLQWTTVTPQVTGHDQPMVRVHLSDGTYLDCTDYHEWCVATGKWSHNHVEERVRAIDLEVGDVMLRYNMPVVEGGADMPHAYTHGFFCADGVVETHGGKSALLYGVKKLLVERLDTLRVTQHTSAERLRAVLPLDMPDKDTVPLHASIASRVDWLAGLLDGDGTVLRTPKSINVQISSVNIAFLRDVRLMLTTLGVQAKIGKGRDAGERLMPDGRGGARMFVTQTCYRLMIAATDLHLLVKLGLKTSRLDLTVAEVPPQRDSRRFVTVSAVERLSNAPVVYCFTEPTNHTGTFEGIVTGQCAEIALDPVLVQDDGTLATGYAACNLTEINASKLTSLQDFLDAAHAATLIGTLQATYTHFPYLGRVTEEVIRRDALLGVGMTGMQDAPEIALNPAYQKQVALACVEWNKKYAAMLGINPAARVTCVKPSGTTTLAVGGCGSGIHPHHAPRYIRRVTADELEVVFQAFRAANPHMCVKKPDGKWVIEFPVEAPAGAKFKSDFGAIEFAEMVRSTQQNWVVPGTARESRIPGMRHNVSNTITVKDGEWDAVADYLWAHRDEFSGVSLLSDFGDVQYAFAPFEAVNTPEQQRRWDALVRDYKPVNYEAMFEAEDGTALTGEAACAGGACER